MPISKLNIQTKMEECEESQCRDKAVKKWHGRLVCNDHYDKYKEEEERVRMTMG